MHTPNSTCRKPHERRVAALGRLPKERSDMTDVRKASLATERASLIERVASGTGYRKRSKRARKAKDA